MINNIDEVNKALELYVEGSSLYMEVLNDYEWVSDSIGNDNDFESECFYIRVFVNEVIKGVFFSISDSVLDIKGLSEIDNK